jgi:beta-lactamase superfamily II metal-dependent hydrolase
MSARAAKATSKFVTIRMYNVGFGDCFLLSFPDKSRPRWMLVDCGVHPSGPGPRKIADVVKDIIADVTDEDGNARIDVVVASHRHADHVSGFSNELWADVEVGEVWMPWTEDPKDPKAKKIREAQSSLAMALTASPAVDGVAQELAANALTNEGAMDMLHSGFAGSPIKRFLPPKAREQATFRTEVLPGVVVHAMSPSRDPDVIRDMDPPKGEAYLREAALPGGALNGGLLPFAASWTHSANAVPPHVVPLAVNDKTRNVLGKLSQQNSLAVATSLEKAVNGTSLVLMLEIGRAKLLFPGDAQWGSWTWMMEDEEWAELLSETVFYKVGHHGSHNATLPAVVDQLKKPLLGMVSTRAETRTWDIPRKPLLSALREHCPVVRSDEADEADPDSCSRGTGKRFVDTKVPI